MSIDAKTDTAVAADEAKKTTETVKTEQPDTTPAMSPEDIILKASQGTLDLAVPIRAGGKDVTVLEFDFQKLTGMEIAEAIDSDKTATSIFHLTAKQGLNMFAIAASKATQGIDTADIKERIGAEDGMAAVQLAILFFNATMSKRNKRSMKK